MRRSQSWMVARAKPGQPGRLRRGRRPSRRRARGGCRRWAVRGRGPRRRVGAGGAGTRFGRERAMSARAASAVRPPMYALARVCMDLSVKGGRLEVGRSFRAVRGPLTPGENEADPDCAASGSPAHEIVRGSAIQRTFGAGTKKPEAIIARYQLCFLEAISVPIPARARFAYVGANYGVAAVAILAGGALADDPCLGATARSGLEDLRR